MTLQLNAFNYTILQVIPRLDRGGAERTVVEVSAAIVDAGGRSLVATLGGPLATEIQRSGGEIIEIGVHSKNPAAILVNSGKLAKIMAEEKVDLVHARSRAPAWSALRASQKMKIPFVTTYHGAFEAKTKIKRFYNSAMLRSDCVIANSQFTARAIAENGEVEPKMVAVIPPGADLKLFDPSRISARRIAQVLEKWSISDEPLEFRLLLPARLTSWKGQELAIDAVADLINHKPSTQRSVEKSGEKPSITDANMAERSSTSGNKLKLRLVLCGDAQGRADYERSLHGKLEELGVHTMVHLVGDCADMPAAYCWADAVLMPSMRPEAFGRVAVEAGAMSRPVIAAAHGGALETVVDHETGILFEPGNREALSSAISKLAMMDIDARNRMGVRARSRVQTIYSSRAMCDGTLGIYRKLLA